MPKKLPEFKIIRDTREQEGWVFESEDKKPGNCRVVETITGTLSTGDYSIEGLTDIIAIERKNGFSELFTNYTPVSNRERFEREMERMRQIKHKYILVETSLNEDTLGLGVPQIFRGPPAKKVLFWLTELSLEYDVHVMFTGDCGKKVARLIFENIARKYL